MPGSSLLQIALCLTGAVIAFLLFKQSVSTARRSIVVLMAGAAVLAGISWFRLWLFAPVMVVWFLLALTLLALTLLRKPRRNVLLSSSMLGLTLAGVLSIFLQPAFMFEFIFKLLEPRDCTTALARVHVQIPLPNETPELYESIVALGDGSFRVTAATRGEVIRVSQSGEAQVFARLPTGTFDLATFTGMLSGITNGQDGAIYTMVLASDPANKGIWRIEEDGNATLWSPFPAASGGNGLTTDDSGNMFVADANLGLIWKIAPTGGLPEVWMEHELLGAGSNLPMPTANGIKVFGDAVFVSNTLHKQVLRIDIESDGTAGDINVWDKGIGGDDFDIDGSGRIYLTTHPFNTVVRLEQTRACEIVGDPATGIAGPTAAIFGVREQDSSILYVLSDGGYSRPVENGQPSIIGLDLARPAAL